MLVEFPDFSLSFPGIPTEAVIFSTPPEVYRQTYMCSWVNVVALLAVHLVHVNFTEQYPGYVCCVTIVTVVAHHRQTAISRTFP